MERKVSFMTKVTSNIRAGFTLTLNGADYYMEKGQDITELVVHGPYTDETLSGMLVGFSIRDRHSKNDRGRIYDGIPTYLFSTDKLANIKDLELSSEVSHILLARIVDDDELNENTDENVVFTKVPVDRIVSLSGSFVDPDGNVTETVDLTDETISVPELFSEADPEVETTLVFNAGDINEPVTVISEVNVFGDNASIPQNFNQNPAEEVA